MSQFITCVPTGVVLGRQRYRTTHTTPPVKAWRCDLTGLSNLYNLYFVACNDSIYVYRPSFPDQNVSEEPELILYPPISSPDLRCHIDPDDPHSITRLLVEYLGNDEILLVTCDDGDVIGYRVEEIKRFLDESEPSSTSGESQSRVCEIRIFLHRNVGASAWGLAVHREARMIAISANTHEVTVLAFALASRGGTTRESGFTDVMSMIADTKTTDFPSPRNQDHVFTLTANHNVPAVSFNNNADDTSGRWLFSNCINGETMLWDMHNYANPARVLQMGWCASAYQSEVAPQARFGQCRCSNTANFPHSSWGAMFLDPHSVHEIDSSEELDLQPAGPAPYFSDANNQKARFRVKNTGLSLLSVVHHDIMSDETSTTSEMMIISESESNVSDDSNGMENDSGSIDNESHTATNETRSDDEMDESIDDSGSQDSESVTQNYTGPPIPAMQTSDSTGPPQHNLQLHTTILTIDEIAQILSVDNDDDEAEGSISGSASSTSSYSPDVYPFDPLQPITRRQPIAYCEITTNPSFRGDNSQTPCVIITKDDIFLLQRPLHPSTTSDPIIIMRRPLHPSSRDPSVGSYDRHCFSTQIPELGIFIIASPVGRAAIFALTKSRESDAYGFKLEYMVPFSSGTENEIVSPVDSRTRLMGVAVGPVQGTFDQYGLDVPKPRERRWRLLMYYTDHTVLSFELARRRAKGEPWLGDLVV